MLLPSMNPDGLVAGQRLNANGKDLNRNFPLDGAPYSKVLVHTALLESIACNKQMHLAWLVYAPRQSIHVQLFSCSIGLAK